MKHVGGAKTGRALFSNYISLYWQTAPRGGFSR